MRLLQLVHGYPPAMGGVEVNVRDISERLVARFGYQVTVFTTDAYTNENFRSSHLPTIPIVEGENQNGVAIRRFPVVTAGARWLRLGQKAGWTFRLPGHDRLRLLYHGPRSPEMARATAEFDCDVICAASFPLNHLTYPFRRRPPRPPVVLVGSIHTEDRWGYDRRRLFDLASRAYATVVHTDHERNWLLGRGVPAARIRLIRHGIDVAHFSSERGAFRSANGIPDEAPLVAYVGQQGSHKGLETLVDVFERLGAETPGLWLVIAGSTTPYSRVLRERERRLPPELRERFRILDGVPAQTKSDLLADCDVFASPSGFESFGITILEAWAHARPVVVGDVPAVREVVDHGSAAVLVSYRHRGQLYRALRDLLQDPQRRRVLGEAGHRRLLERHTLDQEVARYNGLFHEAVAYGGGLRVA